MKIFFCLIVILFLSSCCYPPNKQDPVSIVEWTLLKDLPPLPFQSSMLPLEIKLNANLNAQEIPFAVVHVANEDPVRGLSFQYIQDVGRGSDLKYRVDFQIGGKSAISIANLLKQHTIFIWYGIYEEFDALRKERSKDKERPYSVTDEELKKNGFKVLGNGFKTLEEIRETFKKK